MNKEKELTELTIKVNGVDRIIKLNPDEQIRINDGSGIYTSKDCCPNCGYPWFDCICHPQWMA